MPLFDYQIAAGHDNTAGFDNIEDLVVYPPDADPVPLGPVEKVTLSQRYVNNGQISIQWRWAGMSQTNLETLIDDYLAGNWHASDALVTIRTRQRDNTFADYNATLKQPAFERVTTTKLRNVVLQFRNLIEIVP